MIVIFLDVDGVLNSEEAFRAAWEINHKPNTYVLDEDCVRRLARLVEACNPAGTQIVLSSTWRLGDRGLKVLKAKLAEHGLRLHSITPRLPGDVRGEEIAAWLAENKPRFREVRRILILDDDSDMLPEQRPFFVQTSMKGGLQDEHLRQAAKILEIPLDYTGD